MLLSVKKPTEPLASGFALIGVHQDEAACKNRLFLTFCLQLMNLFKGRWQTGLYTLFKYSVFEKFKQHQTRAWTPNKYSWPTRWHALRTQTSVLYWAPHSCTQLLYIHRPTLGFKLRLHIFPCQSLCCALNLRHMQSATRPKGEGMQVWFQLGTFAFLSLYKESNVHFHQLCSLHFHLWISGGCLLPWGRHIECQFICT